MRKVVVISLLINLIWSCSEDHKTKEPTPKKQSEKALTIIDKLLGTWQQQGENCDTNWQNCDTAIHTWKFTSSSLYWNELELELEANGDTLFISREPYLVIKCTKDTLLIEVLRVKNKCLFTRVNPAS